MKSPPNNEVRRLGLDPFELRRLADGIATAIVVALGGELLPREDQA